MNHNSRPSSRASKTPTRRRQEQIAQAALEILTEQGPAGLSVGAVAERVGLVPSGLYRHYPGKEQILDAVLDLVEARLRENVRIATNQAEDAISRLRALLASHLQLIHEKEAIPLVVFGQVLFGESEERRERLRGMVEWYLGAVADLIRRGQDEGVVDPKADAASGAMVFLGLVQAAAMMRRLRGDGFDMAGHLHRGWDLLRRSLSTR